MRLDGHADVSVRRYHLVFVLIGVLYARLVAWAGRYTAWVWWFCWAPIRCRAKCLCHLYSARVFYLCNTVIESPAGSPPGHKTCRKAAEYPVLRLSITPVRGLALPRGHYTVQQAVMAGERQHRRWP